MINWMIEGFADGSIWIFVVPLGIAFCILWLLFDLVVFIRNKISPKIVVQNTVMREAPVWRRVLGWLIFLVGIYCAFMAVPFLAITTMFAFGSLWNGETSGIGMMFGLTLGSLILGFSLIKFSGRFRAKNIPS